MKKYFLLLVKNLVLQIVSLLIIVGLVAVAAITWPTTPSGQISGGKFQQYFDKIFTGSCPTGQAISGYDTSKNPICVATGSGSSGVVTSTGQEIISGYPNAILCKNSLDPSLNQVFYISGKNTSGVRYSDSYTHAGSGPGSYAMHFNTDGTWGNWFGGAQLDMNDCIGKSLSQLKAMGRTFFYGGSSISGMKRSTVLESPIGLHPIPHTVPDYIFCESGGSRIIGMLYAHTPSYPRVTYLVGSSHQVTFNYETGVLSNHYGTCYFP